MMIWNRQSIPNAIGRTLLYIAEIVTSVTIKAEGNITQWCKRPVGLQLKAFLSSYHIH